MIAAALKLCRLGYDKWDDVDRWTRNQFAECQFCHADWRTDEKWQPIDHDEEFFELVGCDQPEYHTTDRVIERTVGSFAGWPSVNERVCENGWSIMHCCTGNATRVIYQIWQDIVQWENGRLKVNLLLNRASPWADIHSHIPFRGQVDVNVKSDLELEVRVPNWVDLEEVRCRVDGKLRSLSFNERYALIGPVLSGNRVVLEFPISEKTLKMTVAEKDYQITFRGNDVVHIDPPGENCPLYQKEHFRTGETLWKQVERWVPNEEIDWL